MSAPRRPKPRDEKRRIELRHLRYFIAVAQAGNVSRAAAQLGLAQPPLSQQIRQLEQFLQVTLFLRKPRGVELTPAAENFLDEARSILARVDALVETTREIGRGERGEFNLGSAYSGLFLVVPAILEDFACRFPHVTVNFREMSGAEQIEALRQGRLDVAILRLPVEADDLRTLVLLQEPVVVAMPREHPLTRLDAVALADVAPEWMIRPGSGTRLSFKKQASEIVSRHGIEKDALSNLPELNTLLGLVDAGLGIAVVPLSAATVRYSNVVFRPILDEIAPFSLGAAWIPSRLSPLREAFLEVALRTVKRRTAAASLKP